MRMKLTIEELPMATSSELYQLSWVIEQLLADPRRVVQARSQLHLGQQVQCFNWSDGKLQPARVVSMKNDRVTLLDERSKRHFSVSYAAIMAQTEASVHSNAPAHEAAIPSPPPQINEREDLRVGQRVSFTDRELQRRIGLVVRINQQTATLDCEGQTWRVAFGLLHHVVEV